MKKVSSEFITRILNTQPPKGGTTNCFPQPKRHRSGSASEPCVRVSNSHGSSITWRLSYALLLDGRFLWPSLCRGSGDGAVAGCGFPTFPRACAESRDPLPTRLLRGISGCIPDISLVAV